MRHELYHMVKQALDSSAIKLKGRSDPEQADGIRIVHGIDPGRLPAMDTRALRWSFLIEDLFKLNRVSMVYANQDRVIVGSAVPLSEPLHLGTSAALKSGYFTERREIGVINLGGAGVVQVDGSDFALERHDALYIGKGNRQIVFSSGDASDPALFFLVSYPAHVSHPVRLIKKQEADSIQLGDSATSNRRTIFRYIHPAGVQSCQLVAGLTELAPGSVWNTMPVHTHERRSEVYLYFGLPDDGVVLHCMGEPHETRHIIVRNHQAVLSPSWSIHCGAGTSSYAFVWAMGGENQDFSDMDPVRMEDLA
jgi:4-deoxy-L-threo-5-hexosulose-uronate ketol-isomerase